jgi:hypothetical protein
MKRAFAKKNQVMFLFIFLFLCPELICVLRWRKHKDPTLKTEDTRSVGWWLMAGAGLF